MAVTRVLRIDRIALDWGDAPSSPGHARAVKTPEGYLDVDAYLARDGLLRYSDGRSTWLEFRPRDELEAAADSWRHAPVTDDHPPVMVDATTAREYSRGVVISEPRIVDVDGVAYLAARLRVTDAGLIGKILGGRHELSIGFLADVHPEPGTAPGGQRYDAVQRALAGNHVASVERGRAGPAVRVLLDSARDSAESCYSTQVKPDHEVPPVSKPTLDSARATRVIKLPAGTKMDAVKAWCDHAQSKISTALADEVGIPTTKAMLVGPDGTEMEVATWIAALVAEALDARKAGGAAAAPAMAEGEMPEAPEDAAGEPAMPPDDEDKDKKMPSMTPDQITALVRRRGRLERLSAAAGLPTSVIDSADDQALARAYVAHVLPHAKARADAADGAVLDALVEVASSTPAPVSINPFEVAHKTDAADDDDPIVEAYAAHLSR
jgi:hypothetical protein